MTSRREYIAIITAGMTVGLSGCSSGDASSGTSPDGQSTSTEEPTDTDEPTVTNEPTDESSSEVIIDETIVTDTRVPVQLDAGGTLTISVDLNRGTVCVVDVANSTEEESIFDTQVKTEEEFEIPIESDGEYYITFQAHDEATVKAVVRY